MSRFRVLLVAIAALVLVGGGFVGGVAVDRAGALPARLVDQPWTAPMVFDVFWEAWNVVTHHYVDRNALDPTKMTYGAIQGMLAALGDTGHSRFLSPEELRQEQDTLAGRLQGIGAQLGIRDGHPVILVPFPGSPAQQAGLKPGDIIVRVDDQDVSQMTVDRIAKLVRGPAGTAVKLTIARPGATALTEVTITRAEINVPSVSWAIVPGTEVAHILLTRFSEHSSDELVKALAEARSARAKAIILDLRDNPGGLRDEAVAVASQFISEGKVLIEQDAQGKRIEFAVKPGGVALDLPMAILVNEGTASAAEIVAGCLQDYRRGPLVGMTTTGTGTVLATFNLSDGSAIMLGVVQWLTPNGRQIWHQGIKPDVEVELPLDAIPLIPATEEGMTAQQLLASRDLQLLEALKVVTQGGER